MKHPKPDEWVPYLFGEVAPNARQLFSEHLQHCPECRAEIEAWQQSLKKLDAWKLPGPRPPAHTSAPLLKWAVAATIVLGIGFGLGSLAPRAKPDHATLL